jgi:predicted small secreted protein
MPNCPANARSVALVFALFAAALATVSACNATMVGSGRDSSRKEALSEPVAAKAAPLTMAAVQMQGPEVTRRIIRTAELSLEADEPETVQRGVTELAERSGGFVVSSSTSRTRDDDGAELITVSVVFRVPAPVFDGTLQAVRALAKRVASEKVNGQDVTEEYVDLDARIRAQRAVEAQYLSILKDAKTIHDILEVQQKLGEIRVEIDRAEGRLRYLDNQTSLSTFTVHLARHIEAVEASGPGFGASVKKAGHDAVVVSIAIVNGFIRTVGILVPVAALIGPPAFLVAWALRRRRKRASAARGS